MTDLLPRRNDRKILFMCPHRDWKNCPLLGIQNGRRYESGDVTGWETQPRIVRKLAENRVRCQATLGVKTKSILCPRKSLNACSLPPLPVTRTFIGFLARYRMQSAN